MTERIEEIRARWSLPGNDEDEGVARFLAFDKVKHHAPDDIAYLLKRLEERDDLNGFKGQVYAWAFMNPEAVPPALRDILEGKEHPAEVQPWQHWRDKALEMEADRDRLKAQVEHLVGIPSRWALYGLWLIEKTGGCTCGGGKAEPHGPECGVEPIMNLSTLEGWEDLRKAALAYRRPDGGGTKVEVWVVHDGDPDNHQEGSALILVAATKAAAMRHLAVYCGVPVNAVEWKEWHVSDDDQDYWVARIQGDEYHLHPMDVEA